MKKIMFVLGLAVLFIAACNDPQSGTGTDAEKNTEHNDLYFSNDLENLGLWSLKSDVSRGAGHSGKYFSRADVNSPYSFGLNAEVGDLTSKKIKKVDATVWVSVANKDYEGGLICSVIRGDSSIFWSSNSLKDYVTDPGVWYEVKGSFNLPQDLQSTDRIALYVWNSGSKCDINTDDFEFQFSE
jgi:hypothetical protein